MARPAAIVDTARCPDRQCGALLGVPAGFRRGRCPACGALVAVATAAARRGNPFPPAWSRQWTGAWTVFNETQRGLDSIVPLPAPQLGTMARDLSAALDLIGALKIARTDFPPTERGLTLWKDGLNQQTRFIVRAGEMLDLIEKRLSFRELRKVRQAAARSEGQQMTLFNPRRLRRNPVSAADVQRAASRFEGFHGVKPRHRKTAKLDLEGQAWWLLGTGKDGAKIEYVPPGYSERAGDIYSHVWGDRGSFQTHGRAKYYISADGKNILIRGGFNVGDRGIVG